MASLDISSSLAGDNPLAFAGSTSFHATEWTEVTLPAWCTKLAVNNQGATSLWVTRGKSGTRNAFPTDPQIEIPAGAAIVDFYLGDYPKSTAPTISLWGEDGASHPVGFILETR
jgi:hypothetical protein